MKEKKILPVILVGYFLLLFSTTHHGVSIEEPVPLNMCEERYETQLGKATGGFLVSASGSALLSVGAIVASGGTGAVICAASSTALIGALMQMTAECAMAYNNKEKSIRQAEKERKKQQK